MEKEDLIKYQNEINSLSPEEHKLRDLYLKQLANGTLQGPPVGYASVDKPHLKYYDNEAINTDMPKCSI